MATASANPTISVNKMEEDLSCCICYNLLREPKDLDCQHVYCLACLQKWVGKQRTIECPECWHITIVPQDGLVNLQTNLRLKSLVEKYADYMGQQRDVPMCPKHKGECQHFYCVTCKTAVCRDCLVLKHPQPQHDIEELEDIAESKKDEIKVKMEEIQEHTEKSKCNEKLLSEAEIKLQAFKEKAKDDIKTHVQEMTAKLDAKGKYMIQIVENTCHQQMSIIHMKQTRTHENTIRLQNAQSATQNVLDTAANPAYLKQHETIVDRMNKLCAMEHEAPSQDFEPLCFYPGPIPKDSNWFGSVSGNKICKLKLVQEFGQFQKAQGIAANQHGLVAVVDCKAKKTEVFRSNGDRYESKFCMTSNKSGTNNTDDNPYRVCASTDGKFCVTCNDNDLKIYSPAGIFLTSVKSYSIGPIAASPDGSIISGNYNKQTITLLKCNGDKCEVMKTHKIYQNSIESIVSNGTQIVYTTGGISKVCSIDFKTGQALWAINMVMPLGICYESKSNTLLIAGGSKRIGQFVIEQYCITTGRMISRLATGLCQPFAMTVTHDNKLLVADVKTVKVYEIK